MQWASANSRMKEERKRRLSLLCTRSGVQGWRSVRAALEIRTIPAATALRQLAQLWSTACTQALRLNGRRARNFFLSLDLFDECSRINCVFQYKIPFAKIQMAKYVEFWILNKLFYELKKKIEYWYSINFFHSAAIWIKFHIEKNYKRIFVWIYYKFLSVFRKHQSGDIPCINCNWISIVTLD